jgi:hypothetical protein
MEAKFLNSYVILYQQCIITALKLKTEHFFKKKNSTVEFFRLSKIAWLWYYCHQPDINTSKLLFSDT